MDGDKGRLKSPVALVAAIVVLGALGLVAVFALGDSPQPEDLRFADSPHQNVDAANSRRASGPIRAGTVAGLEQAWSIPIASRTLEGTTAVPAVAGEVAYMQDVESNVQAIDLRTGEIKWEKKYGSAQRPRNGVVVADGRVYGANDQEAFALDQESGEELWSTRLVEDRFSQVGMAPGYFDGLVYLSTLPVAERGGEVGVLWALDGRTGRKVWSFDTVPRSLWGNPEVNFGGGLQQPPSFDGRGSMYFGVARPGPVPGTSRWPWGSSRPGPNLYTGSVVNLDARTGELQWHHQVTPHAVCNWGMGSTMLNRVDGRDLVVAVGLAGIVVALDRETGEVVWKRPVGRHNGHDDDGLIAMRKDYSRLRTPVTVYPGALGGVYGSIASNAANAFVPVVNFAYQLLSQTEAASRGTATGELLAMDLASGVVRWKRSFPSAPVGAATVVNDLVLVTTFDGTLYAFDVEDGSAKWTAKLPAGTNAGVTVSGGTVLAPAGTVLVSAGGAESGTPELVAYRLPG